MPRDAQCPKCNAALPRKGRFCLECGLDLYAEGVRQAPSPWLLILVALGVMGAAAIYIYLRHPPVEDPEAREVQAVTREFIHLAADKNYGEIVRRFYKEPDAKHFKKTGNELREIIREKGAQGLLFFRSSCRDDPKEADSLMSKFGSEQEQGLRQYLLGLLGALAFQNGALTSFAGGTVFGEERTAAFLAWYVGLGFDGADMKGADISERLGWQDAPGGGEKLFYVKLVYPHPPKVVPGLPDPAILPWRRLESGSWALTYGESEFHFPELLDFLQRLKP